MKKEYDRLCKYIDELEIILQKTTLTISERKSIEKDYEKSCREKFWMEFNNYDR